MASDASVSPISIARCALASPTDIRSIRRCRFPPTANTKPEDVAALYAYFKYGVAAGRDTEYHE